MKKSQFHVNPAVNKWEEEQRRARMEKMINRAKSTLPPEARGASRSSAPKKPSPYAAENNAARQGPKRSNSSHGARGGSALDARELDGLICDRLQEILGTPLMRRAAAAVAGGKGGTPPKPPSSARAGRRPAWNDDWNAQPAASGASWDEKPVGRAGSGISSRGQGASPPQASGSISGGVRRPQGTPTRTGRGATPPPIDVAGAALQQRRAAGGPAGFTPGGGAGERVVLLPSPTAATSASGFGDPGRPVSVTGRYGAAAGAAGAGAGAGPWDGQAGTGGSHALERSTVSAIVTLNPQAPAAQEAAARLRQYSQGQDQGQAHGAHAGGSRIPRPGGAAGEAAAQSLRQLGSSRQLDANASVSASASRGVARCGPGGEAAASQSLASMAAGPRRPPLAPAVGASGAVSASVARHGRPHGGGAHGAAGEEEDDYADDFEAYEGSDEEGGADGAEQGGGGGGGEGGDDGEGEDVPDVDLLRQSVKALTGLVQLKIQQELARSQHRPSQAHAQATPSSTPLRDSAAASASPPPPLPDMMASLALVGTEDAHGHAGHGGDGGGGLGGDPSLLDLDGLRESDLEYLARLGGGLLPDGEPHGGHDGANSGDEHVHPIEPGAPAGTAKAWGDRHPWTAAVGAEATATGLQLLRARQERERERQQQRQGHGAEGQAGAGAVRGSAEDEDSVLLGETIAPGQRTAAAEQMAAVSSALTALAGSGALPPADAAELASQTDALYGSLVQLHQLMTGPRAHELRAPAGGAAPAPASGFNPSAGGSPDAASPSHSPSRAEWERSSGHGGGDGVGSSGSVARAKGAGSPPPPPLPLHALPSADMGGGGGPDTQRGGGSGGGSHMQLTPKNCLVAEDIAWMAGLVHSLSRSLQAEPGGGGVAAAAQGL